MARLWTNDCIYAERVVRFDYYVRVVESHYLQLGSWEKISHFEILGMRMVWRF